MRRLLAVALVVLALPAVVHAASSPVVAATKRTVRAETTTFQLAATMSAAGQRVTMTGAGAQKGTAVRMSLRLKSNGRSMRMDAILLEERGAYVMYMRSPLFRPQLPAGKSWVRLDFSQLAAGSGIDFSSLVQTSQTLAPLEAGLVSAKRVGRETVAGGSTTRYRAVIDVQRAARAVPEYGKQVASIERASGVRLGRVPYDVWIGDDRRIRRVRFASPAAGGRTVQTLTFLAFDRPVTISAPPRNQVVRS
jgi:hypothetical protein